MSQTHNARSMAGVARRPVGISMLAVAAAHAITDDDLLNPAKWRSV